MKLTPGEDAPALRAAIDRVVARGWFILGPEVEAFENEFAAAMGGARAVGVGTGTDARTCEFTVRCPSSTRTRETTRSPTGFCVSSTVALPPSHSSVPASPI